MLKSLLYDAITEHVQCKECLRNAILTGECNPPSRVICDPNMCKFGKWLHSSDLPVEVTSSPHLKTLTKIHTDFHIAASEVMAAIEEGKHEQAKSEMLDQGSYSFHANALRTEVLNWVRELPE